MKMSSNGSSSSSSTPTQIQPHEPISRSDPTTYVTADTSSFKQVVQNLTSNNCPTAVDVVLRPRNSAIPVAKKGSNKKKGFKLYERRNRVLMISPLAADRRTPEMLSPTILDFPSLTLISPVTPFYPTLLPLFPLKPRNLVE